MTNATMRALPALAVLAAALFAGAAQAQQQPGDLTVRGRVIGPDNAGIIGQRVVLHRVDGSGGATIAESISEEDGRFELSAAATADTSAVYFVAARYDEELYIGPPFRPGEQLVMDQLIQVGIPAMSATALMEQGELPPTPRSRSSETPGWLLLLIPLVGVAGVAVYALRPRATITEERALLIRIAEVDEELATAPADRRAALLEERSELMEQLREERDSTASLPAGD
jgi:hypothetical protein